MKNNAAGQAAESAKSLVASVVWRLIAGLWLAFACQAGWADGYTVDSLPDSRPVNGSHVSNPDAILDAAAVRELDRLLISLEQRTGVQVAVVAVRAIDPPDLFEFAQQLFVRWGLGSKAHHDGLLVLFVEGQRTIRFHTGYGLEGVLPDVTCVRIQRETMVPHFRDGRYGAGLIAGVRQIDHLLSDPALRASPLASATTPEDEAWIAFVTIFGLGWAVVGLIVLFYKSMFGYFSSTVARDDDTPIAMRYSRTAWLLAFIGLPALILAAVHFWRPASPVTVSLATLYLYFLLLAVEQIPRERRELVALWRARRYLRLHALLEQQHDFWLKIALLFPLPFLVFLAYHSRRQSYYRNRPRECAKCAQVMRKLDESEEDAYLTPGQQREEELHSVEHDVWLCAACGVIERSAVPGAAAGLYSCPKCKNKTLVLESNTVLAEATEQKAGRGETLSTCRFCGHEKREKYKIPRIMDSSEAAGGSSASSGSSGSESSSGSSWGGGDSGGGGGSTRW